jgi:hypothetical protein
MAMTRLAAQIPDAATDPRIDPLSTSLPRRSQQGQQAILGTAPTQTAGDDPYSSTEQNTHEHVGVSTTEKTITQDGRPVLGNAEDRSGTAEIRFRLLPNSLIVIPVVIDGRGPLISS